MVDKYICLKLARAFPDSFINGGLEFIAHARSNTYFRLDDCYTELDVKCKVLELCLSIKKSCKRASKR